MVSDVAEKNADMVQTIRSKLNNLPLALAMFDLYCGYTLEPPQFEAQLEMLAYPESAHCWARQLGKTLTVSLTTLFMAAILDWNGAYRTPSLVQTEPPMQYWRSTPFWESYTTQGSSSRWLIVNGQKKIHLAAVTDKQMRGKTLDFLVFDEQAGINKSQENILLAGEKMVQNSAHKHLIRISTPVIGSSFEDDFKRLEKYGWTSRHNYLDFKSSEARWVHAVIADIDECYKRVQSGHYPLWLFRQESLAEFAPAGGAIFTDYESDKANYLSTDTEYWGIDINPKSGHVAVIVVNPRPNVIYIKEEIDLSKDTNRAAEIVSGRLRDGVSIRLELSGPGVEAYKTFANVLNERKSKIGKFNGENWTEDMKMNRVMGIMNNHLIISPYCPNTAQQIRGYHWDEKEKCKPLKSADDHWIDAFLHACHFLDDSNLKLTPYDTTNFRATSYDIV